MSHPDRRPIPKPRNRPQSPDSQCISAVRSRPSSSRQAFLSLFATLPESPCRDLPAASARSANASGRWILQGLAALTPCFPYLQSADAAEALDLRRRML